MAWVATDKYGDEYIFQNQPKRDGNWWVDEIFESFDGQGGALEYHHNSDIRLPKGSIKKLIDKELKWEDNPVKLKEDTKELIAISMKDYRRFLSYANYMENWAPDTYKCPMCGTLNPRGYICIECNYDVTK